jgi:hypothetical protein
MPDSVQFFVSRIDQNTYRVVVQNGITIIRTADVSVADIMDKLGYELEQLQSLGDFNA